MTSRSNEKDVGLDLLLDVVTVAVTLRERADWLTVWACQLARTIKATGSVSEHLRASQRWVQVLARVGYEFPGFVPTNEQAVDYAAQAGCLQLWEGPGSEEPDFEASLNLEHFRQAVKAERQSPIYWIERAAAKGWSARQLAIEIAADEGKEATIPYLSRHKCHSEIQSGKIVLTPLGEWQPSGDDPETLRVTATEVTEVTK